MELRETLEEQQKHIVAGREARTAAEDEVAQRLTDAGFSVEEVDAVSEYVEFNVVLSQMLSREELDSELDAVFEEFEYTDVQALDEGRIRVFYSLCDRDVP